METHRDAVSALGFVHRRLPTGDPRAGLQAVHSDEYGQEIPSILVIFEQDNTRVQVFNAEGDDWATMEFTANVPAHVVNQAVAAAVQGRGL